MTSNIFWGSVEILGLQISSYFIPSCLLKKPRLPVTNGDNKTRHVDTACLAHRHTHQAIPVVDNASDVQVSPSHWRRGRQSHHPRLRHCSQVAKAMAVLENMLEWQMIYSGTLGYICSSIHPNRLMSFARICIGLRPWTQLEPCYQWCHTIVSLPKPAPRLSSHSLWILYITYKQACKQKYIHAAHAYIQGQQQPSTSTVTVRLGADIAVLGSEKKKKNRDNWQIENEKLTGGIRWSITGTKLLTGNQ